MQWNSTQVFDLASFSCVDSWNSTTSVLISDSQLAISSVCQGFDYYVDPTSIELIELGTLQYPFKSLGFVFVELLNFHANTARTINVHLKENTQNYIDLSFNYIINITTVTISSYSTTSSTPSKATIVAGEINDPTQTNITAYYSNTTMLNILLSTKLNKNKQIFSNSLLRSTEFKYLSQQSQVIIVHRSNFTIDNIVLNSTFNDINSKYMFFFAVFLQNRNFKMTNIDTRTSGGILLSYDPMNLFLENIDVDYSRNNWGFYIFFYWNYPEAFLDGIANITNIKFYYSTGDRLVKTLADQPLWITFTKFASLNGIYFYIYSTLENFKTSIALAITPSCLRTDNGTLYVELKKTCKYFKITFLILSKIIDAI